MSTKDVQPTEPTDADGVAEAEATDAAAKDAGDRKAQRKTGRAIARSDRNVKTGFEPITW